MKADVAVRKARLEALLRRVQANRLRLGHAAAVRPAPSALPQDVAAAPELAEKAAVAEPPTPAVGLPAVEAGPPPVQAVVWEAEAEEVEREPAPPPVQPAQPVIWEAEAEEVEREPAPPPLQPPEPAVSEAEADEVEMEIVGTAPSEPALSGTTQAVVQPSSVSPLPGATVSPTVAVPAAPSPGLGAEAPTASPLTGAALSPTVEVPAAPSGAVEMPPASLRIEFPPPLDASPVAVIGAVAEVPRPTIGALLRAAIRTP